MDIIRCQDNMFITLKLEGNLCSLYYITYTVHYNMFIALKLEGNLCSLYYIINIYSILSTAKILIFISAIIQFIVTV